MLVVINVKRVQPSLSVYKNWQLQTASITLLIRQVRHAQVVLTLPDPGHRVRWLSAPLTKAAPRAHLPHLPLEWRVTKRKLCPLFSGGLCAQSLTDEMAQKPNK